MQPDPIGGNETHESSTLRRSDRVRRPTQALVESRETMMSRQERRREERKKGNGSSNAAEYESRRLHEVANLAVAMELFLGENNEYALHVDGRFAQYNSGSDKIPIPQSYDEAVKHPIFGSKWREAIGQELRTLIRFGTWEYVRRPIGRPVVTCKWVFSVKYGADGRVERFKARLVARGFSQREGLDYEDTFAPVIRLESLRVLFALAASYGLKAHVLDATNAFVGSELDKEIVMEPPPGLTEQTIDYMPTGQVCKLLRSLYGLRQSANLWNKKVSDFVTQIGFKPSTADPGVFINSRGVLIALYVDDILVFAKDLKDIDYTKTKLKRFHDMKDGGLVNKILGIRVTWLPNGIKLDQEAYARQTLAEFGMLQAKGRLTPFAPSTDLNQDSPYLNKAGHSEYRAIIGRLTYLTGATRLDFCWPVNHLSQHLSKPTKLHFESLKRVLRYLAFTILYAILYRAKGSGRLVGYVDASYGNSAKAKSTSGYVFVLAGGPVSWSSRRQPVTAMSSSEAEYIAAADGAKQCVWLRHLMHSVGKSNKIATPFYMDNQAAIRLTNNPVMHSKSKHILLRYHAIREFVEHREIQPLYIPTQRMIADGLTKAPSKDMLENLITFLGLTG